MSMQMPSTELTYLNHRRVVHLPNMTCPYCNASLGTTPSDDDHVIGRRFVPKGTLRTSWNLVLRACVPCNNRKSDLEDDLSAISMQPDAYGQMPRDDPNLAKEAHRKAKKSLSRRTRRPVALSQEHIRLAGSAGPGIRLAFSTIAPPQMDQSRAFELARMQLMAFFYWVTFDLSTHRGGFWPGCFYPVIATFRPDWGNPRFRAFMTTVIGWEPRLLASAADDYFRVAIRRHPHHVCWSWALEWNSNVRLGGFFGEAEPVRELCEALPKLKVTHFRVSPTAGVFIHTEQTLLDEDDQLFSWLRKSESSA